MFVCTVPFGSGLQRRIRLITSSAKHSNNCVNLSPQGFTSKNPSASNFTSAKNWG